MNAIVIDSLATPRADESCITARHQQSSQLTLHQQPANIALGPGGSLTELVISNNTSSETARRAFATQLQAFEGRDRLEFIANVLSSASKIQTKITGLTWQAWDAATSGENPLWRQFYPSLDSFKASIGSQHEQEIIMDIINHYELVARRPTTVQKRSVKTIFKMTGKHPLDIIPIDLRPPGKPNDGVLDRIAKIVKQSETTVQQARELIPVVVQKRLNGPSTGKAGSQLRYVTKTDMTAVCEQLGVPVDADPEPTKRYSKRSVAQISAEPSDNDDSTSTYKGTTRHTPRKRGRKSLAARESPATSESDAGEVVDAGDGGRDPVGEGKTKQAPQDAVEPHQEAPSRNEPAPRNVTPPAQEHPLHEDPPRNRTALPQNDPLHEDTLRNGAASPQDEPSHEDAPRNATALSQQEPSLPHIYTGGKSVTPNVPVDARVDISPDNFAALHGVDLTGSTNQEDRRADTIAVDRDGSFESCAQSYQPPELIHVEAFAASAPTTSLDKATDDQGVPNNDSLGDFHLEEQSNAQNSNQPLLLLTEDPKEKTDQANRNGDENPARFSGMPLMKSPEDCCCNERIKAWYLQADSLWKNFQNHADNPPLENDSADACVDHLKVPGQILAWVMQYPGNHRGEATSNGNI
ncbi:hypothetical protein MMC30_007331 [Trapelia coarctata]|nr:hypothetical protein [Trapelia coarctata]